MEFIRKDKIMIIKNFYDEATNTLTYLVYDKNTKDAVVIDPVWDFDPASGGLESTSNQKLFTAIEVENLKLHYILETHAHADHLSGSVQIKQKYPNVKLAIGKNITSVQEVFKGVFNLGDDFKTDGSQFDELLDDGQIIKAGSLEFKVIFTPGHTPACTSFLIKDVVFVGDAIFMPDFGTGRCDFPAGSATDLYNSVHKKLYELPDETKVYVGHDYQPGGRELQFQSTIGVEKQKNIQLKAETTEGEFVKFREERDKTLSAPKLLLPSIQVNIRGGHLPKAENNGVSYLKLPLKIKE